MFFRGNPSQTVHEYYKINGNIQMKNVGQLLYNWKKAISI